MSTSVIGRNRRSVVIVLIVYVLLCAFLALGSYLFAAFPENEAPGGIVLGLTSLVFGIIVPFHLRRVGVVSFRFLPLAERVGKVVLGTVLFGLFFLLLFPAGILWQRTTMAFFTDPPSVMEALSTFQAMLWATAAYGFVFWGGMLHAMKAAFGNVVAVLATSVLFCVYHYTTFALAPPTAEFLLKTLVGGLILAAFTLWARSVLPTLIVHQLGQVFHFATLQENPFAEDLDRFIPSLIMLLVLFGIYEGLFRLIKRTGRGEVACARARGVRPMHRKRQDKRVADEFDRQASHYDDSLTVRSFQRRTQVLVVNEMQIAKGMHILDLGCGTGTATIEIAAKLEGTGQVVGLDLSEKMIEQAERKLAELECTNVAFVVGSGTELGYDGCFDYVLSTNAFHHFSDKERVFSQVWQALKPGGVFLVQDICDDFVLMRAVDLLGKIGERAHVGSTTSPRLRELLASAGFVDIEVQVQKLNCFWGIMVGKGSRDRGS